MTWFVSNYLNKELTYDGQFFSNFPFISTLSDYLTVPQWGRVYGWHLVVVGLGGGILALTNAVLTVREMLQQGTSCWAAWT